MAVTPGRHLTATILGAHLSYVLDGGERRDTRLLLKVVMEETRLATLWSVGDLVMARRQLLNLKHLAETEHRAGAPRP